MTSFVCLCLTPGDFNHPGIAIAASRAGGIGIIDLEFCRDMTVAKQNLQRLQENTQGHIGLRFHSRQYPDVIDLLKIIEQIPHTLIITGDLSADIVQHAQANTQCQLLAEITQYKQLSTLAMNKIDGIIAKGHESGGWVGEDSAFILSQKCLKDTQLPIYIQGGIGIHSSAACRVAGAAGVVLDDQLLLMPESALPIAWQSHFQHINGQEAIGIGEHIQATCRVLSRPGFTVIDQLQKAVNQIELEHATDNLTEGQNLWQQQAEPLLGWGEPGVMAWPVGQAAGLAEVFQQRYQTVGRFIQALLKSSQAHIDSANQLRHLQPDSPLAKSHKTHYPIVQGPMTRVSDSAEFAQSITEAGALPLLALALMRQDPVRNLLAKTRDLVGDKPWGVGMLGFVSQHLREQQLKAIEEIKPPFALIAGGRPDQAAHFEKLGIHTYIHAPVPRLLKLFLDQGARKFIFEGRECGGHVGPLNSFGQWENMIDILLNEAPAGSAKDIHVLFAGGIHDARSTAMVSAMTAPLAERGMKVGVLMGSAYLFTDEIVESGAILEEFQTQAVACTETINLESGPGHASRCAITPFAHEFYATRRDLMRENKAHEEIKDALEDLNLGRLRTASKGTKRDQSQDGKLVEVSTEDQINEGMYMIGQVATMRHTAIKAQDLHQDVSENHVQFLEAAASENTSTLACGEENQPSDIAIVGIGTLLPKAQDINTYWKNILDKIDAITEVPEYRWDWKLYYDEDRNARDKIYSKWGGFLDDVEFDPLYYGIPPNALKSIEPMQLLALEVMRRALDDSGLEQGDFDRENTAVIFGTSGGLGDLGIQYGMRTEIPRYVDKPSADIWDRLPEWTEESFAGCLLNVVAGRVANRFNFGGMNCTVDAACGSSLAAIHIAINELESGRANVAFAGGVDAVQSPFGFTCFSKTQALSPRGRCHTFDKNGDGIAIGEGLAVIAMKRLADAERDGDRIYAVIKASGSSSDGKALGLTAPLPAGQMRALQRVYKKAGYTPDTLGLVEAHGTGTVAGDKAETETVISSLNAHQAPPKACVLGSVKTMIGHTKASAGVAALIKVAMALHHKTLPPHRNVETPIDPIQAKDSPVYLLKKAKPWFAHPNHPRRTGVSAFGFGGTNFHVTLEEYQNEYRPNANPAGAEYWPHELIILRAADKTTLQQTIARLQTALEKGAQPNLADLAYSYALKAETDIDKPACISFIVADLTELNTAITATLNYFNGDKKPLTPNIKLSFEADAKDKAIAFVFPGQGAQYVDMANEPALYLPAIRQAIEYADKTLWDTFDQPLSHMICPPSAYSKQETQFYNEQLTHTQIAQPAIGAVSTGYLDLAQQLGINASMVCGHSYGEYTALHAAGILPRTDFLNLSKTRGQVMANACQLKPAGTMAAVKIERDQLTAKLEAFADVSIANHNSPQQTVITGPKTNVEQAVDSLNAEKISARVIPVAGAFHSPLMEPAQGELHKAIENAEFNPASIPVYSNTTAEPYPAEANRIREQLSHHMLNSVEFVQQIENMHQAGARVFIELGPKRILTGLIGQILRDKEHLAIAIDDGSGSLQGLLTTLGVLSVHGISFSPSQLFHGRNVQKLDLNRLAETTCPDPVSKTTWLINGGSSRPQTQAIGKTGKLPPITATTRPQVQQDYLQSLAAELPIPASTSTPMSAPITSAPQANSQLSSEAWSTYQQTMQQFLALQEQVMQQFIGGQAGIAPVMPNIPMPPLAPTPSTPTAAPTPTPIQTPVAPAATPDVIMPERQTLTQTLLKLVSERTGYPEDMLGLDQDMEAELGIDSIKRVEILGVLQKAVPDALAEHIQTEMETFTRVKSLNTLIDELMSAVPENTAATTAALPVTSTASTGLTRNELQTILLKLVSERTGYPEDMLGLDQDMEAELGIDSIKRVEILGALQKAVPDALASHIQTEMETFTRVKSLNTILDELAAAAPVPTANAEITTSTTTAIDRTELQHTLVKLVSERTGYPEDMLGLDQDMEAELGIDSIKRVEILGALQKTVPDMLANHIQTEMETFTRVKSLNGVLDELINAAPAASIASTTTTTPTPATTTDLPNRTELQISLVKLVSERTGYPEDMLGLDQDMEAELGIDSIKRVEILGALQKIVPESLANHIQTEMETFTRVKSLNSLLDELVNSQVSDTPTTAPQTTSTNSPVQQNADQPTPRYHMQAYPGQLPDITLAPMTGFYLITDDGKGLAKEVSVQITKRGATTLLLNADDVADPEELAQILQDAQREYGTISGLIHLAPMVNLALPETFKQWRDYAYYHGKTLYLLSKLCHQDLQKSGRIVACSLLGGYFGRKKPTGSGLATAGTHTGFLKSLVAEWENTHAKALDFADNLTPEAMAEIIIHELVVGDDELEVGYTEDQRILFRTNPAPVDTNTPQLEPDAEWVVLVTGGARGITAELAKDLAQHKLTLILAGRSPQPEAESSLTLGIDDLAELRKIFMQQAKANNQSPTPVLIEKNINQLLRDREIRQNLQDFANSGAKVEYQPLDVTDENQVKQYLHNIYQQHGRLDVVLHGAGLIEDKLIVDKTPESFFKVFDTKVDSAYLFARYLQPDTLKLLVFFTSVAGRYGNRGQADYASANETVNRLAWRLDEQWSGRVVAINWGPWDTTGMASDEVKRQFEARGVQAIPLTAGRKFFTQELRYGRKGEAEIIAGEGPWGKEKIPHQASPATPKAGMPHLVLLPHEPEAQPNGTVTLTHSLSLASDPYLADHRLNKNPVVPATGAIAWMAEFVQAAWPEWVVTQVRDVNIFKGLVLDNERERSVMLKARGSSHADAESLQVAVEITNPQQGMAYYRASVILEPKIPDAPVADYTPLAAGIAMDVDTVYADYLFHGPRFHRITAFERMHEQGIDVNTTPSDPMEWVNPPKPNAQWLFDPGLLDTGPQLAMVWSRMQQNISALPSRFGAIKRYGNEPLTGPLKLAFRTKPADNPQGVAYDALYIDQQGYLRLLIENGESTGSTQLNRLADNTDKYGRPLTKD